MSPRPSTSSVALQSTTSSPSANVASSSTVLSAARAQRKTGPTWPPQSFSVSEDVDHSEPAVTPDELFVRHTVAEVRTIQEKLKADANAKQSELRLMVGERYRDLLQASASIIAIAESSRRVQRSLVEMKEVVSNPNILRQASLNLPAGGDDVRVDSLQSLAAHVKLLLDSPEHLWRLIESKKYFQATWLFLLARVAYRGLSTDDMEEEGWPDTDVMVGEEQFPLIKRQWETIAHFRSQIGHRAALSLRECNLTIEAVCSVVLALHLLDSKPLTETISVLLTQRSKAAQAMLASTAHKASFPSSRQPGHGNSDKLIPNGISPQKSRKKIFREIRQAIERAFALMSMTVGCARGVFADGPDQHPSLVRQVLDYVQADSSSPYCDRIPEELRLNTPKLLSTLPSPTQSQLLPQNLRRYRPYIDLHSPTTVVTGGELADKIDAWFQRTLGAVNEALSRWVTELDSVRQLWALRRALRMWLEADEVLEETERRRLRSMLDGVCCAHASSIWSKSLASSASLFRKQLQRALEDSGVFAVTAWSSSTH
ncbi:hypothetical protein PUNSTDRAFT_58257 [Punctularia strigosozonata HHB-11173 SS5]|uniref:uncharacterized protein n=1 Tax=Punctularia strigosozonata (strain HHB-11173) TaxID=741275 RepID=UPI0004418489|nr:uncharacterized protein PUNSTDRAFT_58257 [Punctularia strigosozonata HHB-11173 SS5]EIN13973.1 hypothetical protein PUNSTDRAFT_58257 [Punctularia strigosozonata HHB-11173 SS5]